MASEPRHRFVCVNTHIHVEARGLCPVSLSSLELLVCLDWQPGSPQGLLVSPSWLWDYRCAMLHHLSFLFFHMGAVHMNLGPQTCVTSADGATSPALLRLFLYGP